jgi:hypothetical protein
MKPSTRKTPRRANDDELLPEYDFSGAVRGKHAARYEKGTNVVVLDPDVSAVFRNAAAVNEALRALLPLVSRRGRARVRDRAHTRQED